MEDKKQPCCCKNWINANPVIKAVTGHHESCRKSKKLDDALVDIIGDLLKLDSFGKDKRKDILAKAAFIVENYANRE